MTDMTNLYALTDKIKRDVGNLAYWVEREVALTDKIRDLHESITFGSRIVCSHCVQQDYPCSTMRILDGTM